MIEPSKEALDFPAPSVATEGAAILCSLLSGPMIGRDHLDAVEGQLGIERVAVVGLVADQPLRKIGYEPLLERAPDELRFMALTARNPDGDRKAMAVDHCHDLGRLAASSSPNIRAPFFAPAWLPSMYASVRSTFPTSRKCSSKARRITSSTPLSCHFVKRRWHVEYGGYFRGISDHCAPVRRIHRMPFSTSRGSRHGRPPFSVVRICSGPGMCGFKIVHWSSVRSIDQGTNIFEAQWKGLS